MRQFANGNVRILPTKENVRAILKHLGIKLYYDVILRRVIIEKEGNSVSVNSDSAELLAIHLADLAVLIDIKNLQKNKVIDLLTLIAREDSRNIPLDKVKQAHEMQPLDTDETAKLFNCFEFETGDPEQYKPLFYKWLAQVCAMLSNENGCYGAEAVLALIGGQGIGKTQVGHKLSAFFGQEYFLEGLTFDNNKDSILKGTACVIGELGEFVAHREMVNRLKAIITANQDVERVSYGRMAEYFPRLSTFYITSNEQDFLADAENRRFWVFPLLDIDLDEMDKVNMLIVWAEAYERWLKLGQEAFRPNREEAAFMASVATGHRRKSREEQALLDQLAWDKPTEAWVWLRATDIAQMIGMRADNNVWVGRALKSLGYSPANKRLQCRKKNTGMEYFVPPLITSIYDEVVESDSEFRSMSSKGGGR